MNQKLSIACPNCSAVLSIPSTGYLGKTVSCPQCDTPFLLEERATELPPMADIADPLPAPPAEEPAVIPTAAGDAPAFPFGSNASRADGSLSDPVRRSRHRPRSGARKSIWIFSTVGFCALALTLLVVVLLKNGPGSGPTEMDFMPDNAELLVHVRVSEFLDSNLSDSLVKNIPTFLEVTNGLRKLGIPPRDIETLTVGMAGVSPLLDSPERDHSRGLDFTIRLRLIQPLDIGHLVKSFSEQNRGFREPIATRLEGRPFYVAHAYDNKQPPVALFVVDETTLLFGVEQSVRQAVSQDGKSRAAGTFRFLDFTHQFLVGFVPHDSGTLDRMIPEPGLNQSKSLQKVFSTADGTLNGLGLAITMASEMKVTVLGQFTSRGPARTCATELTNSVEEMHEHFSGLKSVATGQQLIVTTILKNILGNVHASHAGNVAQLHFSVPETGIQLVMATIGGLGVPGIGDFFGGDLSSDDSPGVQDDPNVSLEDEMTKLVLLGVTEESLSDIKSMFDDPEYVLMDYLDRWLTDHIGAAVTITASIDNEEAFVEIAGINDVEALAEKIDFGTVLEVNARKKMVTARWKKPGK